MCSYRGVARGGAEGARAPPEFSRSVNPFNRVLLEKFKPGLLIEQDA